MMETINHTAADAALKKRASGDSRATRQRHRQTRWLGLLAVLLTAVHFAACSKQADIPKQPAKPPEPKNQTYRMIGGRSVISLVSSDELEIREGGQNIVCKYTKQDGKLRVVISALGTTTAKYFNVTPQGLVDEGGVIYYAPTTYEKVMAQINLNSQLVKAVERDDPAAIDELLRKGAAIETHDERGSVLAIAVNAGFTNAVGTLLKNRADPNRTTGSNGETPLWKAIAGGHVGVVELLLKYGARPGNKRPDGLTPLMLAASVGGGWFGPQRKPEHDRIVSVLCEAKVDLNAQDNDGYTALGWGLRSGNLRAAKILVDAGADRQVGKDRGLDAFTLARGDDSKIDALRTPSEREERKSMGARYRQLLVGVWRDSEGAYTYNADGTKSVRFNNGRKETGTWSVDADILTFDHRKGRIIELSDTTWALDIDGTQWRAARVTKAEIDQARAKLEKTRQMLVGTWRDAAQRNLEFTINADGTMEGNRGVASGKWSIDGDIFTSSTGKRHRIISIDDTSFVFKRLDDIWGGNWRATRVR